jgi:hypothetical protein
VRPHLYSNEGTAPAKGVWFVFGLLQQNHAMRNAPGGELAEPGATVGSAVDVLRAMDDLGA